MNDLCCKIVKVYYIYFYIYKVVPRSFEMAKLLEHQVCLVRSMLPASHRWMQDVFIVVLSAMSCFQNELGMIKLNGS